MAYSKKNAGRRICRTNATCRKAAFYGRRFAWVTASRRQVSAAVFALVATMAVRNILACRVTSAERGFSESTARHKEKFAAIVEFVHNAMHTKDPAKGILSTDRLLQEIDIQRLKGLIYRDMASADRPPTRLSGAQLCRKNYDKRSFSPSRSSICSRCLWFLATGKFGPRNMVRRASNFLETFSSRRPRRRPSSTRALAAAPRATSQVGFSACKSN